MGGYFEVWEMKKKKVLAELFLTMFKIGMFTFGGGYAMIAIIENELVSKRKWMEREEFFNMIAISESTPGPIAINMATYLGYKIGGFFGSLTATVAVVIPSFAIIYAISLFFDAFLTLKLVEYAFKGIQICVIYLILSSGIKMFRELEKAPMNMILFFVTLVGMVVFSLFAVKFTTILYIVIGGIVGLCMHFVNTLRKKEERS